MNKILLIDGNSLTYRGYYATSYSPAGILKTSDGIPTNAVMSMFNMMHSIINKRKPTHILVAFDAAKKTNRHDWIDGYKGGRNKTPEELIKQFPIIKEMISLMGIKTFEINGWEADDIIATFAKEGSETDFEVEVLSSDKDLFQLVNKNTQILFNNKGVSDLKIINNDNFYEINGHNPCQVPDIKGLVGDPSDNLPGIKGVGIKGANKLLEEYCTLENIFENIDNIKGSLNEKISSSKEISLLCKKVATLNCNVEIPFKIEDTKFTYKITNELIEFFTKYELNSLIKKYGNLVKDDKKLSNIIF